MQPLRHLRFLFLPLLAATSLVAHAEDAGETYTFHRPSFTSAPGDLPKAQRSGDVALADGSKVAAYSLTMGSGIAEQGFETFAPEGRKLDADIKPGLAAQLDAYAYPLGIILVPKGWAPRSAGAGADGSVALVFAPDNSGQSYLSFSHTGACVGCAYSEASPYFAGARKLAKENDFMFYRESNAIQTVPLNPWQMAYSVKAPGGNPVDGLAFFDADGDIGFYDVQISIPAAQHALATALLNQFVLPKKRK